MRVKKNIVLVGFMGTGKTSVGKALAKKMGRPVIDIDRVIEEKEKRKIGDIFEKDGEPRFREIEKETIRAEALKEGAVITTGGGAVLDPQNVEALRNSGYVIALLASPETIFERVRNAKHRPLLNGKDMLAEIKRLLTIREPHYRQSDYQFQTDGRTADQVADMILNALKEKP